jgi:hypothetical protein
MFLLYLDASGTPDPKDVNTKHYVLVGLCMHESTWFGLDKRIQVLKRKYCFPGEDPERFEIHVKQFAVSCKEQEDIGGFDGLSWTDRRSQVRILRDGKLKAEKDPDKHEKRRKQYRETDPTSTFRVVSAPNSWKTQSTSSRGTTRSACSVKACGRLILPWLQDTATQRRRRSLRSSPGSTRSYAKRTPGSSRKALGAPSTTAF